MNKLFMFLLVMVLGCATTTPPLFATQPTVPAKPEVACTPTPAQAQVLMNIDRSGDDPCQTLDETECEMAYAFMTRCKMSILYWNKQ